jgi:hypothetical protein
MSSNLLVCIVLNSHNSILLLSNCVAQESFGLNIPPDCYFKNYHRLHLQDLLGIAIAFLFTAKSWNFLPNNYKQLQLNILVSW